MIPVSVLTGFLGSGKTTLLGHLLSTPEFSRTAVIINEFGEIGLDHDLVEASEESFIQLQTGCLCCAIRGDLALTLEDILRRRDAGSVPPFERVVIETSGLADPAPILQLLMTDASVSSRLGLAGVITTVDSVNGESTLQRQKESVKQVAVADRLVLTKADLRDGASGDLLARLKAINPQAPVLMASFGRLDPAGLFDVGWYDLASKAPDVQRWLGEPTDEHPHAHDPNRHADGIDCYALVRDEPLPAVALTLFLEALADHCGADLLRVKGLIRIVESPDRPAVFHGVQHVFHPPAWLRRWPSEDRRSRLVFIVRGIPRDWIEALLAAIEVEVRDVAARTTPTA